MSTGSTAIEQNGSIGVISDTHGVLRPEVVDIFRGVDMILHAGDIGSMDVIKTLEAMAPVTAVRGNMDSGLAAIFLEETETVTWRQFTFHILHDLSRLAVDPAASGIHMIISGHTHLPEVRNKNGVMYLNPGSAGPRRPGKPVSFARVSVHNGRLSVRHFRL